MSQRIDIYSHERKHATLRGKLEKGVQEAKDGIVSLFNPLKRTCETISVRNAELILGFDTAIGLEGLSKCRRIKCILVSEHFARYLQKDFDILVDTDIQNLVSWIDQRGNVWTRQMYRGILKKLIKYVRNPQSYLLTKEYPESVRWITTHIKRKDKPKIQREQLLTEEEILRCIRVAEHPRDKALFALQTETGCRVGELANMQIKDIISERINPATDEREYYVRLNGKTGERIVIVFYSVPYLLQWLNAHPKRDDPNSPLWTLQLKNDVRPALYPVIRKVVKQIYTKAGIQKLARTHYLRHSRITIDCKQGISDSISKKRFGWVEDTRQLATYSHVIDEDVHDHYRAKHNKTNNRVIEPLLTIRPCHKCGSENPITNDFCTKCCAILSAAIAERLKSEQERKTQEMEMRLRAMEQMLAQLTQQLSSPMTIVTNGQHNVVSQSGLSVNQQFFPFRRNDNSAGNEVKT